MGSSVSTLQNVCRVLVATKGIGEWPAAKFTAARLVSMMNDSQV